MGCDQEWRSTASRAPTIAEMRLATSELLESRRTKFGGIIAQVSGRKASQTWTIVAMVVTIVRANMVRVSRTIVVVARALSF
jgi:hypothetical protein